MARCGVEQRLGDANAFESSAHEREAEQRLALGDAVADVACRRERERELPSGIAAEAARLIPVAESEACVRDVGVTWPDEQAVIRALRRWIVVAESRERREPEQRGTVGSATRAGGPTRGQSRRTVAFDGTRGCAHDGARVVRRLSRQLPHR